MCVDTSTKKDIGRGYFGHCASVVEPKNIQTR